MPVRSFNSRVLKWPKVEEVIEAFKRWAKKAHHERPEVLRVGYFGSYARGNWGVGSDLDVVIILRHSDRPFIDRAAEWNTLEMPVPVDVFVYTESEWTTGMESRRQFRDVVWIGNVD